MIILDIISAWSFNEIFTSKGLNCRYNSWTYHIISASYILQFSNRVHYLSPEEFLYTFSQRSRYTQRLEKFSNAEEPLRRSILNQ